MAMRPSLTWVVSMLLTAASAAAQGQTAQTGSSTWQVGTTPSVSSGRYGGTTRTDIVYTPITARRLFPDGDLTLVVPFLCITGDGGVTVLNGAPVRQDPRARLAGGTTVRGGTTARTVPGQVERHCGVGDLVVRGRYYLLDEHGWLPTIALRGHVKAPTASAERGLGTGKPDEGIGVEISRKLGAGVLAMVDGGYTLVGKPDDASFRNSWWYDAGIGHDFTTRVNLSVFFEEYASIIEGLPSARDILAAVTLQHGNGWRLQIGGQVGLSDGAPDHGLILGASRRF
jgi:hypothetical protein